jgi:hypothetical protein
LAAFDALIPERASNTAPAQTAQLVDVSASPTKDQNSRSADALKPFQLKAQPASTVAARSAQPKSFDLLQTENDKSFNDQFPTLGDALASSAGQVLDAVVTNKARAEIKDKKKEARVALTDAWFQREEIRKKLAQTFELEAAQKLQKLTAAYNDKRIALQDLMGDGSLPGDDAKVFPVLGPNNLDVPKHKPQGFTEWRARRVAKKASHEAKTTEKRSSAEEKPEEKPDEAVVESEAVKQAIEVMETAKDLRQGALDFLRQPRPQNNIRYGTWKQKGEAKRERADNFYRLKFHLLEKQFPQGMPPDLRKRFPKII